MLYSTAAAALALIALAPVEAALLQPRVLRTPQHRHYRALSPLASASAQGEMTDVQQELEECLLDAEGPDVRPTTPIFR